MPPPDYNLLPSTWASARKQHARAGGGRQEFPSCDHFRPMFLHPLAGNHFVPPVLANRRSAACVSPFVLGERCRAVRGAVEFAIEHCQRVASIGGGEVTKLTANLYCVIA